MMLQYLPILLAVSVTMVPAMAFADGDPQPGLRSHVSSETGNGHANVAMALNLPHPAASVWSVLSDFGNDDVGADIAWKVDYSGDETGGIRTIHLLDSRGGGSVAERIYDVNPENRSLRYMLVDFGIAPFADYKGYMKISERGAEASVIYYAAKIFPDGISPEAAAEFAQENMLLLQKRLHALLSE